MSVTTPRRIITRRSGSRGQSVVEFALIVPIMVVILFAIVDFARIYTTLMTVESAAREAADYATELGAVHWAPPEVPRTEAAMHTRACVASKNLPDYSGNPVDTDGDGINDGEDCTNPSLSYCITASVGGPCTAYDPAYGCESTTREPPCQVTVTLSYTFHLLAPFHIELFGVQYGVPSTIDFQRNSTFAMTDIQDPGPTP
jgi:Flp pilus assembly protein TadG